MRVNLAEQRTSDPSGYEFDPPETRSEYASVSAASGCDGDAARRADD
jgi:hypothetical protein